jgi:hypothetical protein
MFMGQKIFKIFLAELADLDKFHAVFRVAGETTGW